MENSEHVVYVQSDDRCIPPSQEKQSGNVNEVHKMENYDANDPIQNISDEKYVNHEKNINTSIDVTKSVSADDKNDEFVLTVDNIERIKCERQKTMGEINSFSENHTNISDRIVMTPSPTLKLEMKTEATLITDALNLNSQGERMAKDATDAGNEEASRVKLESIRSTKISSDRTHFSNSKVIETTNNITAKTEHNYHKSEKEEGSKSGKDHR